MLTSRESAAASRHHKRSARPAVGLHIMLLTCDGPNQKQSFYEAATSVSFYQQFRETQPLTQSLLSGVLQ